MHFSSPGSRCGEPPTSGQSKSALLSDLRVKFKKEDKKEWEEETKEEEEWNAAAREDEKDRERTRD